MECMEQFNIHFTSAATGTGFVVLGFFVVFVRENQTVY
jgi:hypothetical protein